VRNTPTYFLFSVLEIFNQNRVCFFLPIFAAAPKVNKVSGIRKDERMTFAPGAAQPVRGGAPGGPARGGAPGGPARGGPAKAAPGPAKSGPPASAPKASAPVRIFFLCSLLVLPSSSLIDFVCTCERVKSFSK